MQPKDRLMHKLQLTAGLFDQVGKILCGQKTKTMTTMRKKRSMPV